MGALTTTEVTSMTTFHDYMVVETILCGSCCTFSMHLKLSKLQEFCGCTFIIPILYRQCS